MEGLWENRYLYIIIESIGLYNLLYKLIKYIKIIEKCIKVIYFLI